MDRLKIVLHLRKVRGPMMGAVTPGCAIFQASANCDIEHPLSLAIALRKSSTSQGDPSRADLRCLSRLASGRLRPAHRGIFTREQASTERAPWETAIPND